MALIEVTTSPPLTGDKPLFEEVLFCVENLRLKE